MASVIKQKNAIYIEWTVKTRTEVYSLPVLGSKIDSNCFMFQDQKCRLEFYTDTSIYGDACLYFKRYGTMLPELNVMISVFWIHDSLQCSDGPRKVKIERRYDEIWNNKAGKLLGDSLTFQIFIHAELSQRDECVQTGSYLNGNASVESLSEDFSKMLDSGLNHDAEIKCGEHSIKVHKNILCARSEVFKAMLESDMMEGQTGVVEMEVIDISNIQDSVRYLYTGLFPELTYDKAKVLYETGDKYLVKSLMLRCSDYLQDNVSPDNVCHCLAIANVHSDEKLRDKAITYILHEKVYLQDKHWLPFYKSCPRLANEVYRKLHENTGSRKSASTCEKKEENLPSMTVLKKVT